MGMTASQAQRVFSKAIVTNGTLDERDILLVTEEKKQIVRQSEALEFYSVTETPDNVGGLGVLKEWLRLREKAFTKEARDYGLPAPKGIALLGIPGTGKSLTAKMIGALWRLGSETIMPGERAVVKFAGIRYKGKVVRKVTVAREPENEESDVVEL